MKLYDTATAPSPRRVRIFMLEKGIEIPTVPVDLANGEHLQPPFLKRNPWATVPVLELDDGTCISEVSAVCLYLEEAYPNPPLMGRNAKEKAVIQMWDHRIELDGFLAIGESFRNHAKRLQGRALTGVANVEQIPALVERGRERALRFFSALDTQLANHEFVAGDHYSVADITAMVCVDFARAAKVGLDEAQVHAQRWHEAVRARPSAQT